MDRVCPSRLTYTAGVFTPSCPPLVSPGSVRWWAIGFAALAFGLNAAIGVPLVETSFTGSDGILLAGSLALPLGSYLLLTRTARVRRATFEIDARRRFLAPAAAQDGRYLIGLCWLAASTLQFPRYDVFLGGITLIVVLLVMLTVAELLLGRPRLILDPDGLTLIGVRRKTWIGWDDLVSGTVQLSGGGTAQAKIKARRRTATDENSDLVLPAKDLHVDAAFLAAAISCYLIYPGARADIGTAEGLQRLQATT
jgi:hypothetical protein